MFVKSQDYKVMELHMSYIYFPCILEFSYNVFKRLISKVH